MLDAGPAKIITSPAAGARFSKIRQLLGSNLRSINSRCFVFKCGDLLCNHNSSLEPRWFGGGQPTSFIFTWSERPT